jgi:hypothetical protein
MTRKQRVHLHHFLSLILYQIFCYNLGEPCSEGACGNGDQGMGTEKELKPGLVLRGYESIDWPFGAGFPNDAASSSHRQSSQVDKH